jgi:hypothetical protein
MTTGREMLEDFRGNRAIEKCPRDWRIVRHIVWTADSSIAPNDANYSTATAF